MRALLKWTLRGFGALALGAVAYVLYALVAWRDIPVAQLEQDYGGDGLRTATIDGLAVRYKLEGRSDPGAPVLVLIHSHFFEMGIWDGWLPEAGKHFRVLRYDLAGHGLTGPDPSGTYSVDRDVALLDGLLAQAGIQKAAIVGSSLGGNVAFTFAARHPQGVTHLVLANSGGLKRESRQSGREMPGWADAAMPLVPPAAFRAFLEWMVADDAQVTDELATRFVHMWRREGNRRAELARLRQHEAGDTDALLAAIAAPTLVLWGEANPQLPVAQAEEFRRKLSGSPRVAVRTYPGAGHVLPVERPRESVADALAFLLEPATP